MILRIAIGLLVGAKRFLERNPFHVPKAIFEKLVRLRLDPCGDGGFRRPAVGGLYLNPPSGGGLCDGVITMPSASPVLRPRL